MEDMESTYFEGATLERKDRNGHYEPGNVVWATPMQQARNRSNNRVLTYGGRSQCLAAWAGEVGMSRLTLKTRLSRGWSLERALTEVVHH